MGGYIVLYNHWSIHQPSWKPALDTMKAIPLPCFQPKRLKVATEAALRASTCATGVRPSVSILSAHTRVTSDARPRPRWLSAVISIPTGP